MVISADFTTERHTGTKGYIISSVKPTTGQATQMQMLLAFFFLQTNLQYLQVTSDMWYMEVKPETIHWTLLVVIKGIWKLFGVNILGSGQVRALKPWETFFVNKSCEKTKSNHESILLTVIWVYGQILI